MLLSRCQKAWTIGTVGGTGTTGRGAWADAGATWGSPRNASGSRCPADRPAGSSCGVVIAVHERDRPTDWKAEESMTLGAAGMREPTAPGTTTKASTAMSAARATTLGSRTSGSTLPEIALQRAGAASSAGVTRRLQRRDRRNTGAGAHHSA